MAAVFGPVVVLCMLGARYRPGRVAAVLLAVVSASSWGLFAVLTKGVVDLLGHGPLPLLRSPELYAWLVVATAGTVFQQSSFRAGALTVTLPTMTVTEPVVAAGLGVALLGEGAAARQVGWVTLVVAVVVMIVATAALARDEAADAQLDRPDDMAVVADRSSGR
ncbi:hypothetical protein C1Y40_05465 [Mycobacterium talmoniae]|uniref:Uncharacterized protein n=1 Tax=Mycobacterium talmoniae TaxID=1858794 RepID=A0A2S8BCK6_9MYCO|nr:hypothetical protein C1Y40_05465 [Mycobacterium talmoniae]